MKGMKRIVGVLAVAGLTGVACEPIDDGGPGPGGSGVFSSGFAFVRADRNVYVVDEQGDPNSPRPLTTGGGARHPAVSRDGRNVVFVRQTATGTELQRVATLEGAQATTVFASGSAECSGCGNFRFPTFSPNGAYIVFVFDRGPGSPTHLGRVNVDGSGFQNLTPGATISFGAPSFFPDNNRVLAPAGNNLNALNQLAVVSLQGAAPNFIASTLGNTAQAVVNRAVVSADGQQVAFDGRVSTGASRIFVSPLPLSGNLQARVLTDHPGEPGALDTFPSWMGPGRVGFLSSAGGSDNIYRVSVDATGAGPGTLVVPSALEPSFGP
jgi:TolB protein